MRRILHLCLVTLLAVACREPESLTYVPSEAGPIDLDMTPIEPDMAPVMDASPPIDMDDAAVPEGPCGLPADLPAIGPLTVIGGGEVSYLVWFQPSAEGASDGALVAQRVELRRQLDSAGADDAAVGIAPTRGPLQAVRCVTDFDGELRGVRLPGVAANQSAWVLFTEGGGAWRAVDVTGRTDEIDLGLYGPLRTAQRFGLGTDPDTVLVVGRTGADATAAVGLRALGGFGSESPSFLQRGIPLPVAVAATGADWIFAFADGTCMHVEDNAGLPSQEFDEQVLVGLGTWTCQSRDGDLLVGSGALNSMDNPLFLARYSEADGLALLPVRPGQDYAIAAATFTPAEDDAPPMMAPAGDAGSTLINSLPEGVALNLVHSGRAHVVVADEHGLRVLAETGTPAGVLRGPQNTVFTVHVDGSVPSVTAAAWADAQPTAPDAVEDDCPNRRPERCDDVDHDCDGNPLAGTCCWDEEEPAKLFALRANQSPTRKYFLTDAVNDREQQVVSLAGETLLLERGFVMSSQCTACWPGRMNVRLVANQGRAVALAVALDDLEETTCGETNTCGFQAPSFEPGPTAVAPYHALALYERRTADAAEPARFLPSPCQGGEEIHGLEVHTDLQGRFVPEAERDDPDAPPTHFIRVFCETMWFDQPFDGSAPVAQLYADIDGIDGGVNVQWLGPSRVDEEGARFVARRQLDNGELQVDVWRSRNPTDAAPVSLAVEPRPEWLAEMSPEDTVLPFALPSDSGLMARVVPASASEAADGPPDVATGDAGVPPPADAGTAEDALAPRPVETTMLERFESGLGWVPAPTTRWPIDARISPDGTLAVSTAHLVAPTADNLGDQRVGIFVHDLTAGVTGWGRQVEPIGVIKFNGYHGITFMQTLGAPHDVILGVGEVGGTSKAEYMSLSMSCTATAP